KNRLERDRLQIFSPELDIGGAAVQSVPPNKRSVDLSVRKDDVQLEEPIFWESVVAHVEFRGKNLQSITFQTILRNKIGQGEPETQDEHTNNLYLQTRGLPKPATGDPAGYILQRLADSSRPCG